MKAMKVVLAFLLMVTVALATTKERWVNDYDLPLYYKCENHQSISMIISIHDNKREDRVWDFQCQDTFSNTDSCYWTEYINDFDEEFTFICPFGSVMSGLESYHSNSKEDRRWKFHCCKGEKLATHNCKWSNYVNEFDDYLRWDAPPKTYLTGAHSYHDNKREDRRWKFHSCEVFELTQ